MFLVQEDALQPFQSLEMDVEKDEDGKPVPERDEETHKIIMEVQEDGTSKPKLKQVQKYVTKEIPKTDFLDKKDKNALETLTYGDVQREFKTFYKKTSDGQLVLKRGKEIPASIFADSEVAELFTKSKFITRVAVKGESIWLVLSSFGE